MKNLSKKEKFRLEKQKSRFKKKLIIWTFLIFLFTGLSYWVIQSSMNSVKFSNPEVNLSKVPSGPIHWHPNLEIRIDGEKIVIPDNIGIGFGPHSPTHTHDEGDGTIHLENSNPKSNPQTMSLGYFFNLWKESFNQTCILNKCINLDGGEIHMYVDGEENFEYENYVFGGNEKILIEYKSK